MIYLRILLLVITISSLYGQDLTSTDVFTADNIKLVTNNTEGYIYVGDSVFICLRGYHSYIEVKYENVHYDSVDNKLSLSGHIYDGFNKDRIINNSQIIVGEFIKQDVPYDTIFVCGAIIRISKIHDINEAGYFQFNLFPNFRESICFTFKPYDDGFIEAGSSEIAHIYQLFKNDNFTLISNTLKSKLNNWIKYAEEKDTAFRLNNFVLEQKQQLDYGYMYDSVNYDNRIETEYYFLYSPDSSLILDIYSYTAPLELVNGDVYVQFDLDSEALLINTSSNEAYRLLVYGSSAILDDATWIDNQQLVVVGYSEEENNNDYFNPVIWYFDLQNKIYSIYTNPSRVKMSELNYYFRKFPYIKESE